MPPGPWPTSQGEDEDAVTQSEGSSTSKDDVLARAKRQLTISTPDALKEHSEGAVTGSGVTLPTFSAGEASAAQQPSVSPFSGPISAAADWLCIETCAGSGMLSSVFKQFGFRTLAVDFEGNKQKPYVHVLKMDLRKPATWDYLQFVVLNHTVLYFHAAPFCGTASRARDRRLSSDQHGPPPLRSQQFPMGLPSLSGANLQRVQSANAIYLQLAAFCSWLHSLDVWWAIETPPAVTFGRLTRSWNSLLVQPFMIFMVERVTS